MCVCVCEAELIGDNTWSKQGRLIWSNPFANHLLLLSLESGQILHHLITLGVRASVCVSFLSDIKPITLLAYYILFLFL